MQRKTKSTFPSLCMLLDNRECGRRHPIVCEILIQVSQAADAIESASANIVTSVDPTFMNSARDVAGHTYFVEVSITMPTVAKMLLLIFPRLDEFAKLLFAELKLYRR